MKYYQMQRKGGSMIFTESKVFNNTYKHKVNKANLICSGIANFQNNCRNRVHENRGPDFVAPLRVTLEDIFFGKQMEIKYTKQGLCPHCRGNGAEDFESIKKCTQCGGQGVVIKRYQVGPGFYQQVQEQYIHSPTY